MLLAFNSFVPTRSNLLQVILQITTRPCSVDTTQAYER